MGLGIKIIFYYVLSFVIQYAVFHFLNSRVISVFMLVITPLLLIKFLKLQCDINIHRKCKFAVDSLLLLPLPSHLICCMLVLKLAFTNNTYLEEYYVSIIIFMLSTIGVNSGLLKILSSPNHPATAKLLYKAITVLYILGFIFFIFWFIIFRYRSDWRASI